jgi:hypothetical protein
MKIVLCPEITFDRFVPIRTHDFRPTARRGNLWIHVRGGELLDTRLSSEVEFMDQFCVEMNVKDDLRS